MCECVRACLCVSVFALVCTCVSICAETTRVGSVRTTFLEAATNYSRQTRAGTLLDFRHLWLVSIQLDASMRCALRSCHPWRALRRNERLRQHAPLDAARSQSVGRTHHRRRGRTSPAQCACSAVAFPLRTGRPGLFHTRRLTRCIIVTVKAWQETTWLWAHCAFCFPRNQCHEFTGQKWPIF